MQNVINSIDDFVKINMDPLCYKQTYEKLKSFEHMKQERKFDVDVEYFLKYVRKADNLYHAGYYYHRF